MEAKIQFISSELRIAFEELEGSDERLFKEIEKAIRDIEQNSSCGRNVRKKLIPKELIRKYGIDNLWIYNLRKDWRLLYSIGKDEVELIALILDWMGHRDYEKLFKFT